MPSVRSSQKPGRRAQDDGHDEGEADRAQGADQRTWSGGMRGIRLHGMPAPALGSGARRRHGPAPQSPGRPTRGAARGCRHRRGRARGCHSTPRAAAAPWQVIYSKGHLRPRSAVRRRRMPPAFLERSVPIGFSMFSSLTDGSLADRSQPRRLAVGATWRARLSRALPVGLLLAGAAHALGRPAGRGANRHRPPAQPLRERDRQKGRTRSRPPTRRLHRSRGSGCARSAQGGPRDRSDAGRAAG